MRELIAIVVAVGVVAGMPMRAAAETANDQRLRRLEETVRKQQEELQDLHKALKQQNAIGQATQKQAEQAAESAEAAKTATGDATKKMASLPDWLNKTTVFGDVRARHEGFYNQPTVKGTPIGARNRERVRARLGVRFALNDELSATIRGASGNINDPISTNETLTGNFNRKNFNLDWAFLTLAPGKTFGWRPGVASITAGKFPLPQFKVGELVFDEDVSGEGVAETFQLLGEPLGMVDQIKVHAMQLTFSEVSNAQDGWMFGGQLNPSFHFGNVQLEAGMGQFWWLNPDLIATSLSRNTTAFTSSGAPVTNSGFNSALVNTNLLVNQTIQPPTPTGGKKPASFSAITGYQSAFNESNVTLGATIPNVVASQPLRMFFDYVYNWDAINDDAHGYQAGLKLGQTKTRGDWAVTAFYERLEQEAVISSFTASDFGNGGTNLQGPVFSLDYQLLNPLTLTARTFFTNFLNRAPDQKNPTQARLQLDAIVRF